MSSPFAVIGASTLLAISPKASPLLVKPLGTALARVLPRYDIVTVLRLSHFLSQAAHESDGFRTLSEYGGPAYFAKYDGRSDLGNVMPGDGARYHGRGIFQLTGRANYRTYGKLLGIDLEADPDRAAEPELSLEIACLYWRQKHLNAYAEQDDCVAITRLINGGRNGLTDRRAKLVIAKREVAAAFAAGMTTSDPKHYPVLRRGSSNEAAVEDLQARLQKHGFPLTIDGDFGAATELAVKAVQTRAGLNPDGIVGAKTWLAIVPQAAVE